jgi:transmembrane sensor
MTSSEQLASSGAPAPVLPLDWALQAGKVSLVRDLLATKLQRRRRRRLRTAGAIAAAVAIAAFASWAVPFARHTQTIATAPAQRTAVALADGSVAELNARTGLRTDFRYGRRTVRLDRGEAFFSVAKDAAHPFLVETPAGTIRVTGTQFNVRLTPNGKAEVTLVEGSVTVLPSGNLSTLSSQPSTPSHLLPGQRFDFASPGIRTLSTAELENSVAWRTGRLALDGLTLGEAAARVAEFHGKTIAVAPDVAARRVGGSCPLADLPGFLEFVKEAFGVRVLQDRANECRIVAR